MDLGLHLHATGKTKNLYLFKKRFVSSHLPFHHKAFCKRKLTDGKFLFTFVDIPIGAGSIRRS